MDNPTTYLSISHDSSL